MNPIVRRFIKTAIVFLIIGLCLGAYVLVRRELFDIWPSRFLLSAHTHAVFVGFVMFMILGVALWLFPKPLGKDRQVAQWLVELCYWLLTLGTGARVIGELARTGSDGMSLKWLVVVAGLCQVVGVMAYSWAMWKRIRPQRRFLRQQNDEGYAQQR